MDKQANTVIPNLNYDWIKRAMTVFYLQCCSSKLQSKQGSMSRRSTQIKSTGGHRLCVYPANCQSKGDSDHPIKTRNPSFQIHGLLQWLQEEAKRLGGVRRNAAFTQFACSFTLLKLNFISDSEKSSFGVTHILMYFRQWNTNIQYKSIQYKSMKCIFLTIYFFWRIIIDNSWNNMFMVFNKAFDYSN